MRKSKKGKELGAPRATFSREPLREMQKQLLEHLRREDYARRSVMCYDYDLRDFVEWLEADGARTVSDVTPGRVQRYHALLASRPSKTGRPLSAGTRVHVVSALLALGKFVESRLGSNPAAGLRLPRVHRKLPDNVLTVRQMEKLLATPRLDDVEELRDRALMELLYASGLRQAEALDLQLGDVDLAAGELRVRRGKGGDPRMAPLGKECVAALSAYLSESRPVLAAKRDSGHFFVSRAGTRLWPCKMHGRFKRYAKLAGIARSVGFHTFRHSVATHLLQRGAGLRYIQELLGHRSLGSTQIYTRVTISDLKAAHAKFHPRERMDV